MLHRGKRTATDSVSANRKYILVLGFRGAEWALWLYVTGGGGCATGRVGHHRGHALPAAAGITSAKTGDEIGEGSYLGVRPHAQRYVSLA